MFRKRTKISFIVLIMMALLLCTNGIRTMAAGVRPLVIEMSARPGDLREFEISLTPDVGEEIVDLTLYEPVQQLSGGLIYQLPINPSFSATSWVTLDSSVVRVLPGAEAKVTGTIRIPFSASGSHTVIIMVEPRPPKITSGIGIKVRYAVRLNLRVEKPGSRPQAELVSLHVAPDSQGAPEITGRIKNPSPWDYLVSGEVVIRDQERRLVERITLQTPAGRAAGADATRIYPGAEIEFKGKITRPLTPGEYSMQAFFRYAESGQLLLREKLIIAPGEYVFPGFDELGAILVTPTMAEHQLRAGERKTQIFEFENVLGDPVQIRLALAEVMPDYDHSLVEWIELRSKDEFVLPARAKTRLAMTIATPRDVSDGSYHGKVAFKAFNITSDELLSKTVVPINVVVGTEHLQKIHIRSITAQTIEDEGTYLSIDLLNNGNVAFFPQVSGIISNEEGEFVERVIFQLPNEEKLLPRQIAHGTTYSTTLEPGIYEVEIEIAYGGRELSTEQYQIEITD